MYYDIICKKLCCDLCQNGIAFMFCLSGKYMFDLI